MISLNLFKLISMPIEIRMVLGFLTGLVVSFVAIPSIVRVATAKKLFAVPNCRTSHNGYVPSLGGVAIFAVVVLGTSLFIDSSGFEEFRYILAAIMIVFFIGLKDDLVNLRWTKKLAAEIFAALLVVIMADVRIETFHGMLGVGTLPYWFSIVFSTFVFIALINCFNLLDGIDGLASGMGIVISLIFGFWLFMIGFLNFAVLSFVLAGGLISFYGFNVFGKNNKLFMGDTGSLLLGFLFAILAIKVLCCEVQPADKLFMRSLPTVVMGVMIIPIIDTMRVFTTRILRGKSPFSADKTHLHHIFLELGFSHWQASSTIIVMSIILFCLTLIMRNMNAMVSALILFSTALIISLIPCYMARNRTPKVEGQLRILNSEITDSRIGSLAE